MATDLSTQKPIRFQIEPTPGETQRACSAIVRACLPPSRRSHIMIALYVVIGAAAGLLTPSRLMTFIIGVGAVLATESALRAESRSRVRRLQASDPHALETHYVELGPEGVHAWCGHIDARYPWQDYYRVLEDREFYLLVRPSGSGTAIPKRLLDAPRDAELRERIREWAPEQAAGLARPAS